MEDSIQLLPSPEVIEIGDDLYDYEDRDGDIEVIGITDKKLASEKKQQQPHASSSTATVSHSHSSLRRPRSSGLTGRRVFSPTDEILNGPNFQKSPEKETSTATGAGAPVNFTSPEEDSDLSVIEIIPPPKKPFPGPNRFAPNPVFRSTPRKRPPRPQQKRPSSSTARIATGGNAAPIRGTPSSNKRARLSSSISSAAKLSKKARKRREKLEARKLTPKSAQKMLKNRRGGGGGRKESLIQQSLRNLSNNSNTLDTSAVSTSSASTNSSPRKKKKGNTPRKSLKRLKNPGTRNWGARDQENVVSSTVSTFDAPSASLRTAWDYKPPEYERLRQQQAPDSSSMVPVPRNLDFLPPLPFSDGSGAGRGTGRRGRGRGHRGNGPTRYGDFGYEAGVSRNPDNFELAPARFSPPPPITYSVDSLFNNTFGAPAVASTSSAAAGAAYNPMAMLTQAKASTSAEGGGEGAPKLALSAFGGNLFAPTAAKQRPGTLRPIVIDGSNVAMGHGNNKIFSCRGIRVCVDFFKARGHQTIIAFIPQFKGRGAQTVDAEVLEELEAEGVLKRTPGRTVDRMKISAYDDRFIVQSAAQIGGIIISNDNFRDLYEQEPSWRETIHRRVLQYVWITPEMIMFPDDPLGRGGPRLNQILQF